MTPIPRPDFDPEELAPGEIHPVSISRWEPIDLDPVLRGEAITPAPTVFERSDGIRLLYPGRINALIGETEACKTWVAMAVVAQELMVGHHVIYADFEDGPESAVERLRALGVGTDAIAVGLTYLNPGGRFDELAQAVIEEAIRRRGEPSLAVVDGVTEAMSDVGLDPMSGIDVATYHRGSPRWLARTGAAVALIDHVTKSQEGRGRWAIGSERKISGLDGAAFGLESLNPFGRGRKGLVKLTVAKDRSGHVRQHAGTKEVISMVELRSWPEDGVTVSFGLPEEAGAGSFRPTHIMSKLSEAIIAQPGLSSRALRAAVSGKSDTKDLALELLIKEGFVGVEQGARGARYHHSLRPFGSSEAQSQDIANGPF